MAAQQVLELRIRLEGIDPPVWRRLLVPGGAKMARLHDIFQTAMGWTDVHLHSFTVGDDVYSRQDDDDDYDEEELDENEYTVSVVLGSGVRRLVYDYDFGDSWEHEVVVEDSTWSPYVLKHAVCLDGQGVCPPEDVGGVGGYKEFLEALADPTHEEHETYLAWVGYEFDASAFSVAATNAALQRVR
jgi:Plasmid pRiA4b ORF-3-like protein